MGNVLENQLYGLSTLLQLVERARQARTVEELAFLMVNETHVLMPYRQAALWLCPDGGGKVAALSGVALPDGNGPYMQWLKRALSHLDKQGGTALRAVTAADLPPREAGEWAEWLPEYGLWVPLVSSAGEKLGALLLARETEWEADQPVLDHLRGAYGHALAALDQKRTWLPVKGRWKDKRWGYGAVLGVVLALWTPVPLTVLAPAQVTPLHPAVQRAPLEGVVDSFHVKPNDSVTEGQLLFELDPTSLRSKTEVARKAVAVAEAEYRQAAQQALYDQKSKAQLAILQGRMEEKAAEVDFLNSLLDRIQVRASRGGIAIFDDANEWIGKPVVVGERIMTIADPAEGELEIWLPVADAITVKDGAEVRFFLNIAPQRPVSATLRYASYEAVPTPEGVLAYRLKASFAPDQTLPRIGLKGTAKIYGDKVSLFYYLMRRPLAAARQWLGI